MLLHEDGAAHGEAAGVGEDAGAARSDATLGQEDNDVSQEVADFLGRVELGEFGYRSLTEEVHGEVVGVAGFEGASVLAAEAGVGVLDLEPAAAAVGEGKGATAGVFDFGARGLGWAVGGSGRDGGLCHLVLVL